MSYDCDDCGKQEKLVFTKGRYLCLKCASKSRLKFDFCCKCLAPTEHNIVNGWSRCNRCKTKTKLISVPDKEDLSGHTKSELIMQFDK